MLKAPSPHKCMDASQSRYIELGLLTYIRVVVLIVMGFNVAYLHGCRESLPIMFSTLVYKCDKNCLVMLVMTKICLVMLCSI